MVHALAPIDETFREMTYLWLRPPRLRDGKLRRFLAGVPETPLEIALRATLQGLGRLDTQDPTSRGVTAPVL